MKPDFKEQLNEGMKQVSLKDLMPGFDKEAEWIQLSQQLHKKKQLPTWSYAAAAIILLLLGTWLAWQFAGTDSQPIIAQSNQPIKQNGITIPPDQPTGENKVSTPAVPFEVGAATVAAKKNTPHKIRSDKHTSKEVIKNGTPCPILISISQTVKCPNSKPASIQSSSTLEPDQSQPLNYKTDEHIAKNCSLTIKEIEIKSIVTGETILLNSNSSPATAQDVFSVISGQKKGNVLAGMFTHDCENQIVTRTLRVDNRYGDIIIQ